MEAAVDEPLAQDRKVFGGCICSDGWSDINRLSMLGSMEVGSRSLPGLRQDDGPLSMLIGRALFHFRFT